MNKNRSLNNIINLKKRYKKTSNNFINFYIKNYN